MARTACAALPGSDYWLLAPRCVHVHRGDDNDRGSHEGSSHTFSNDCLPPAAPLADFIRAGVGLHAPARHFPPPGPAALAATSTCRTTRVPGTDPGAVAVVTAHEPIVERVLCKGRRVISGTAGRPIAAGILPPGASEIGVIPATNEVAIVLRVRTPARQPGGLRGPGGGAAHPSSLGKDSIKAVTWTNAHGSQGRKERPPPRPVRSDRRVGRSGPC